MSVDLMVLLLQQMQNVASTGKEVGAIYVAFVRNNMDQLRSKVADEFFLLNFYERWYAEQMNVICNWLSDRIGHALHFHQVTCLAHMLKVSVGGSAGWAIAANGRVHE